MILDSTFYKNISRTIVSGGSGLVFPTDVVLLCDTTSGAINLTLCEIPSGDWNTIYKLYVVDSGNNASVNNIVINAPVGFKINGQPSVTINTNGDTYLIRVTNDTNYFGLSNYNTGGGSGSALTTQNQGALLSATTNLMNFVGLEGSLTAPNQIQVNNAYINVTQIQLSTLITGNDLIPNQWYGLSGVTYGSFASYLTTNNTVKIYLSAVTNNKLSNFGYAEFWNADYQKVGDYSNVVGFTNQLGLWYVGLPVVIGDVVIYANLHYKNITGVNGASTPDSDLVNWSVLDWSVGNGYINVYDQVNYDIVNNRITFRRDQFMNEVDLFINKFSENSFNGFPFGNNKFRSNIMKQSFVLLCQIDCVNDVYQNNFYECEQVLFQSTDGLFRSQNLNTLNFLDNGRPFYLKEGSSLLNLSETKFHNCSGELIFRDADFRDNNFQGCAFNTIHQNSSLFRGNNFVNTSLSGTLFASSTFNYNFSVDGQITFVGNYQGSFSGNIIEKGFILIENGNGDIINLTLIQSNFTINNAFVGNINFVKIENASNFTITDFLGGLMSKTSINNSDFSASNFNGTVEFTNLLSSQLSLILFTGQIDNFSVTDRSLVTLNGCAGLFRNVHVEDSSIFNVTTSQSVGTTFSDTKISLTSNVIIGTLTNNFGFTAKERGVSLQKTTMNIIIFSGEIAGMYSYGSEITVGLWDGAMLNDNLQGCTVDYSSLSGFTLNNIIATTAKMGIGGALDQTMGNGFYSATMGSISAGLDMDNPAIYDPILFQLDIPASLRNFCSVYFLINCGGKTIKKITGIGNRETTFIPATAGVVTFETVARALAVGQDIVSNQPPPASINLTYATSGRDYIVLYQSGFFNEVLNFVIVL